MLQGMSSDNVCKKQERKITALVDEQCTLAPFSVAVRTTNGIMTYRHLSEEISGLCVKLGNLSYPERHRHGKPVIGLHMGSTVTYVVSVLAVAKGGLAFLPLPLDLPTERLRFTLQDAGIRQVLVTKENFQNIYRLAPRMNVYFEHDVRSQTVVLVDLGKGFFTESCIYFGVDGDNGDVNSHCGTHDGNDFLYLMYTSGSTGRPKCVKIKESSVVNLAGSLITCWDIVPVDVVAQFASIGFDASISEIFIALLSGASLAVLGSSERLGPDFVSAMNKMAVTTVTLPPSALNIYDPDDFPHLTKVISAGEACNLKTAIKWVSSGVRLFNAYGPTESTVCASCYEYQHEISLEDDNHRLPIGKAIDGVNVYLLDEFMQPVHANVVGEIYIGGQGLSHGYIGHAASLTDKYFVQNPLVAHQSLLYKTGDYAFQDCSGNCTYIGRTDGQVKIRGHRIHLGEIEQVLVKHPDIDIAVVVIHRCSFTNDYAVVAYVAPMSTCIPRLKAYLKEVLPKYMMPTYIKKMDIEDLPKSANGKVDKKKLELAEVVHDSTEAGEHRHLDDIQGMIARLWCQVCNFDDSIICTLHQHSSFSELGGNSLHLVLLVRLIEDETKRKFSFTEFAHADTIEDFAEVIRRRQEIERQFTWEETDPKTKKILRQLIYRDSELPTRIRPNPGTLRSIHKYQQMPAMPTTHNKNTPLNNILLSGVTGFLGAFLLSEILDQSKARVYCMVRAPTEALGNARVIDNMKKYGLWKRDYISRIVIILSDLSKQDLGIAPDLYKHLCYEIDVVFMNAATMNFNKSYKAHRRTNVLGTKKVIRFATTGLQKYLFFTSSLSVFLFPSENIESDKIQRNMTESDFLDDRGRRLWTEQMGKREVSGTSDQNPS